MIRLCAYHTIYFSNRRPHHRPPTAIRFGFPAAAAAAATVHLLHRGGYCVLPSPPLTGSVSKRPRTEYNLPRLLLLLLLLYLLLLHLILVAVATVADARPSSAGPESRTRSFSLMFCCANLRKWTAAEKESRI